MTPEAGSLAFCPAATGKETRRTPRAAHASPDATNTSAAPQSADRPSRSATTGKARRGQWQGQLATEALVSTQNQQRTQGYRPARACQPYDRNQPRKAQGTQGQQGHLRQHHSRPRRIGEQAAPVFLRAAPPLCEQRADQCHKAQPNAHSEPQTKLSSSDAQEASGTCKTPPLSRGAAHNSGELTRGATSLASERSTTQSTSARKGRAGTAQYTA